MSTLVVLRTHRADSMAHQHARELAWQAGMDFCIALDETCQEPVTGDIIPVGQSIFRRLGLFCQGGNETWKCGDYTLYAVRRARPHYRYYWLIEHDVRLDFAAPFNLFRHFSHLDADWLGMDIRRADPEWHWTMPAARWFPEPWRCLFSLLRASGVALDSLYEQRCEHSYIAGVELARRDGIFSEGDLDVFWPNDEAFVMGAVRRAGLSCLDMNGTGHTFYAAWTVGFNRYHLAEDFANRPPAGRAFHSVVPRLEFACKMQRSPDLLWDESRALLKRISGQMSEADTDFAELAPVIRALLREGSPDDLFKIVR
jgi:hypothetical protein